MISGAMTYSLLRDRASGKRITIFFDNHTDVTYCTNGPPRYVSHFADDINGVMLIEKPPIPLPPHLVESPTNAPHTRIMPKTTSIRIDIRPLIIGHNYEETLDQLRTVIHKRGLNRIRAMDGHFAALKKQFSRLEKGLLNDGGHRLKSMTDLLYPLETIDGLFPYTRGTAKDTVSLFEDLLSATMEFNCIFHALNTTARRPVIIYVGAAHAFRIHTLLSLKYGFDVVSDHNLNVVNNVLELRQFDLLRNCTNTQIKGPSKALQKSV